MAILDGKQLAQTIKEELRKEVDQIKTQGGKIPHLVAVLIGDNPASQAYVRNKVRSCEEVGFLSTLIHRPADTSEKNCLKL